MHSKGYIHLDLKPANFLIGLKDKKSIIYLSHSKTVSNW